MVIIICQTQSNILHGQKLLVSEQCTALSITVQHIRTKNKIHFCARNYHSVARLCLTVERAKWGDGCITHLIFKVGGLIDRHPPSPPGFATTDVEYNFVDTPIAKLPPGNPGPITGTGDDKSTC